MPEGYYVTEITGDAPGMVFDTTTPGGYSMTPEHVGGVGQVHVVRPAGAVDPAAFYSSHRLNWVFS